MPVHPFVRQTAREATLIAAFAAVYAWPIWSPLLDAVPSDHRLAEGIARALASPAVVRGLALDLAAHLILLTFFYAAQRWLAVQLSRTSQLSRPVAALLVFTCGWLWMVSGNAVLFSRSNYSVPFAVIATSTSFALSSAMLLAMVGFLLWSRRRCLFPARWRLTTLAISTLLLLLAAWSGQHPPVQPAAQRNIIIVGVDSLSAPLLAREQERLPHLNALLASAANYERAYTPLGRTYPAWVSILSGRPPASNGALFNLRGVEHADRDDLLSKSLQTRGYHTVYAIDERRFNNIDESFGFDRVVGPRAGALDFAIQSINDTPLTNLLLQTRAAQWLLPYSYLNVASAANYDARGFVDEIGRASVSAGPLFLAVHFLSGHFPYATRHATMSFGDANDSRAQHVEALTAVDTQVGSVMSMLARQGRLDDALVIVLSDHGEALGDDEPIRLASGEVKETRSYGHGADLLSEHQNRVVLGVARYRHGQPEQGAASHTEQVSLLDVRGAAESFARTGNADLKATSDCIAVETELRLASTADYRHLDMGKVAAEGANLYEVDDEGRLRLREGILAELTAKKDVGLRCADRLTVFKPSEGRYRAYLLSPGSLPQEAEPRPADTARVDAYRRALLQSVEKASGEDRRKTAG